MLRSEVPLAFDFESIELVRIPVTIAGTDYLLEEAGAEAGAFYEDAMIGSVVMKDGKPISVSNVKSRDLTLLAMCLYAVNSSDKGPARTRVQQSFVNALPRKVADTLIESLKAISGLGDTEEDLGNESSDTETSSE